MDPRRAAVFLVLSTLLGASARATPTPKPSPVAAVRASLLALKNAQAASPAADAREKLAALSKSAANLKLTGDPAFARARLDAAIAEALITAPDDEKSLPDLLKKVATRGDELLAVLSGTGAIADVPPAVFPPGFVEPPPNMVVEQPKDVSKRALGVLNGYAFATAVDPGAFVAAGPGARNLSSVLNSPAAALTGRSDLGIAVPGSMGGPTSGSAVESRFHDASFDPSSYQTAGERALDHLKNYIAPKPPGMPSLAPITVLSQRLADRVLSPQKTLAAAPAPTTIKAMPSSPVSAPPPPHLAVGTTGGFTEGKIHMATGRFEAGNASLEATLSNIGRPDLRYGLNTGDLKVWVSHRPAGDLLKAKTGFGASTALDAATQLTGSVAIADTRKGTDTTFMLGLSGALSPLAP